MQTAAVDVLIVGAGPTGLTLANLLARMDVSFLLIDKNAAPSRESKAFGIHARTLEIFDQLGLAQKAVQQGSVDTTVHLFIREKEVRKFQIGKLLPGESNYSNFLILAQNKTEQLLVQSLEEQGQKVNWQHEFSGLEEEEGRIKATIKEPGGEEKEVVVQYLAGCDGASSQVRQKAGFSFEGRTYSPTFYLADSDIDWPFPHGDVYFTVAPEHVSGIFSFREKNRYRIFNFLNTAVNKQEGKLSQEEFQQIMDSNPYLPKKVKDPDWFSVFKIHSRLTNCFQKGRVLLAGDAGHVHSPVGGQGMNTGIQDAYNLAWKLSLVVKGTASADLLRTYHEERHVIARNLHRTTDRFFQLMVSRNKLGELFRLYVFPRLFKLLTTVEWLRKRNLRRASQLAIRYRFSTLSKQGSSKGFLRNAPRAGDRSPFAHVSTEGGEVPIFDHFSCTRFTLLLATSKKEERWAFEIAVYARNKAPVPITVLLLKAARNEDFYKVYGIKSRALFLIRPDGHIAYCTSVPKLGELKEYLDNLLAQAS